MRKADVVLVALLASSQWALAQTAQKVEPRAPPIYLNGLGQKYCGTYLAETKPYADNSEELRRLYQQWGAGFFAGLSFGKTGKNPVADFDVITAWLDKWCADNPADTVVRALSMLVDKVDRK